MVETTKICPFCKSEIPTSASKCAHCGSEVSRSGLLSKGLMQIGLAIMLLGLTFFCLLSFIGLI